MGNRGTDLGSSDLPNLDSDASASEDERVLGRRHLGGRTKYRYMTKTVHHGPMLALHVHNHLQCSIDISRTVLDQANTAMARQGSTIGHGGVQCGAWH